LAVQERPGSGTKWPREQGPALSGSPCSAILSNWSYILSGALSSHTQENTVDKDRIKGAAEQAKGKVKEVAGKVTGDSKLEGEGKADQVAGKIQNAIGGIKDTLRGK
jgi:uncharacterized protein YjbJ (UPF0337 family)